MPRRLKRPGHLSVDSPGTPAAPAASPHRCRPSSSRAAETARSRLSHRDRRPGTSESSLRIRRRLSGCRQFVPQVGQQRRDRLEVRRPTSPAGRRSAWTLLTQDVWRFRPEASTWEKILSGMRLRGGRNAEPAEEMVLAVVLPSVTVSGMAAPSPSVSASCRNSDCGWIPPPIAQTVLRLRVAVESLQRPYTPAVHTSDAAV